MESFFAGCVGGGVGIAVGHPFDTVKVRLQTQKIGLTSNIQYKGIVDCVVKIIQKEGVTGFYKGLTPPLVGLSIQNAFLFGVQHNIIKYFGSDLVSQFKAGCITGAVQSILSNTIELAKIQLQVQGVGQKVKSRRELKLKGTFSVFSHLYKTDGIRGCFRGNWVTLARDCPGCGAYFYIYAYFCHLFTPHSGNADEVKVHQLLLAGGLAGALSWAFVLPIDVIKSKIQAEGFLPHGRYKNYMDCIRTCYRSEGIQGFTRGLLPTVVRAFPVNAVTLCTVSILLRLMNRESTHDKQDSVGVAYIN
ncbi:mitochondrial basic amino acids transporter-like isoform X2 [Hydractinia symbiolongicarpus]|nr:mitochondrial basic amino acids transporter-like isoform X2 [Hydractinia symbiolongicarpus]